MLRSLYERTLAAAAHRHATWWLALVSFVESSVFPIPPDVMLIPMVLADRTRWIRIATVCTLASVAGGVAGYAIGLFLFDVIGQALLDFYGYGAKFATFGEMYNEWGAWIVFGAGVTPFPYKVITIASGVTVSSSSTGAAAMTTSGFDTGSLVIIENLGTIQGHGGDGACEYGGNGESGRTSKTTFSTAQLTRH